MIPGSWATYRGRLVQVLRIEGGKSRKETSGEGER